MKNILITSHLFIYLLERSTLSKDNHTLSEPSLVHFASEPSTSSRPVKIIITERFSYKFLF